MYVTYGQINDNIETTNVIVNANVKIGIKIMLARTDMIFKLLKKKAIITIIDIVVAALTAKLVLKNFGSFIRSNTFVNDLLSKIIPATHEKLINALTSKARSGFIIKQTMPAKPSADKLSYSLRRIGASSISKLITVALTTDIEKLHIYI